MGGIRWRRAEPADYQAVLDISHGFTFDYTPAFFHMWCHNQQYHPLAGEKDGKIIAFTVPGFTDTAGKTCTGSGSRVVASEQAGGVFTSMKIEIDRITKIRGFRYNLSTVLRGPETERVVASYLAKGLKIVHRARVSGYSLSCSTARSTDAQRHGHPNHVIKSLVPRDIPLHAAGILNILSREGTAFLPGPAWMPLRVTLRNIRFAASLSAMFVGSQPQFDTTQSELSSVSFCCVFPFRHGLRMLSVVYSEREDECEAHVRAHLDHLGKIFTSGRCEIMLLYPMRLDEAGLEQSLASVLGPREKLSPQDPREMTVMELTY